MLLFCLPVSALGAEDELLISQERFPDRNFRKYVSSQFDGDLNGQLSQAELQPVTELLIADLGIADLTGIEYFESLQVLDCSDNQLNHLNLAENKNLKMLNCRDNGLSELDVSSCESLKSIDCSNNELTGLTLPAHRLCFSSSWY